MAANTIAPVSERCVSSHLERPGRTHYCKCVKNHPHVHLCLCGKTWGSAR